MSSAFTKSTNIQATAAEAAERILRRQASVHRLASHGEVREYHTRRRWWVRRVLLGLTLFLFAGPINHGFYASLVRHRVLAARPNVATAVELSTLPLQVVRTVAACTDFSPAIAAAQTLDAVCADVEFTCDYFVQVALSEQSLPIGIMLGLPLILVAGYALSPGPVWWGFRLCAIELMTQVYALMECLYAPLAWLVDRSRTAREFYEAYYDSMEWID